VTKKFFILILLVFAAVAVGCSKTDQTANGNANTATEATTKPGPDNSEITTSVDANGVKTEERVFHGNPRVAKVVVTTDHGTRTVKVYSPTGEERELNKNEPEDALEATGSAIADGAGFVAHKSGDVAGEVKDKSVAVGEKSADTAKTVADKTVDGTKTVAGKTVEGAKTVGDKSVSGAKKIGTKTVEGAKTVGSKTEEGAKKVGSAVKKVIP
jgi:hypothetical protein